MRHKWTDTDRAFIQQNAASMKDAEIALVLSNLHGIDIKRASVAQQRAKLGVAKIPGRGVCKLKTESPPF